MVEPCTAEALAELLERHFAEHRPRVTHEKLLQEDVHAALVAGCTEGRGVRREHSLSASERLDFFVGDFVDREEHGVRTVSCPAGVAVELKVAGSPADVQRQLWRYTRHASVRGVLLVTTKHRHRRCTGAFDGKPVVVLHLGDYLL